MEMTPIEVRDDDEDDGYQTHMSEFSDATGKEVEDHITEILEEEEPKKCDENHCEGHKVEVITPEVGMKFEDPEQMYELFKTYGKKLGFSVRRRHSRKGDDGVTRYLALGCSRGTKIKDNNQVTNPLKRRPQWGTDCKVRLTACLQNDGSWVITKVFLDHNHDLSPNKVRYYRCHRKLPPHMQRRLLINDVGGVRGNKNINSVVVESGGYEQMGCIEKDCRNFLDKQRRLRLGEGDGIAILNYFLKMQATNTGFVFCMDLDHEDRLRNVFWADGRCREAYKEFGDVITFDSTYLTNKYDMPFSPFVCVNHHGQSILLGCALLSNEDIPTFVWLFNTWLKCMNGVHPKGIITDQDKAMQAAIASVFPDTRHRWCLWHIMKKLKDKIGNRKDKDVICATVKNVFYDTQTTVEFEKL